MEYEAAQDCDTDMNRWEGPRLRIVCDVSITTIPAADLIILLVIFFWQNWSDNSWWHLTFQRSGDKTPADLFSFFATDLNLDNSRITGESEPQECIGITTSS